MIVVDNNIIAYLLISGERTEQARQLYAADSDWLVPSLWQHEFLNVLANMVKYGGGNVTDALGLWQQAITLVASRERIVSMPDALKLAVTFGASAYDAQYVALAESLNCTLVTEDTRLIEKFPGRAMTILTFLNRGNGENGGNP